MGFSKNLEPADSLLATAKKKGDWGEKVACDFLVTLGCAIDRVQWRGNGFEMDIVAFKGTRVLFVEVKMREKGDTDPVNAVDASKRRRMIRAAHAFLQSRSEPLGYQFDIIAITGTPRDYKLTYVEDAFFPSPSSAGEMRQL